MAQTRLLVVKLVRSGRCEQYCTARTHSTCWLALDVRIRCMGLLGWEEWLVIEMNKMVSSCLTLKELTVQQIPQ